MSARKMIHAGITEACLIAGAVALGAAAIQVDIREWPVPWSGTRPRDPYPGPGGRIWFVGQAGDYLAHLDPTKGAFGKVPLESGAGPHNLVVDKTGQVWFTGNKKGYIGRLDPATGKIARYPMPDAAAGDPHTLALGRDGVLWFTVQFGGFVGRLEMASGAVRLVKVPSTGARPYGIAVDSKGRPYFNEFGVPRIGTLDPATLELKEYPLPNAGARGRRIAVTRDDRVWYVDYARGFLARLDPATGDVREWPTPGGDQSLPYAMAADDRDRLWAVETGPQPNRLIGFDPREGRFFAQAPIPGGGGTVRHMVFVAATRELWFGTDKDTVGRARIP